MVLGPYIRELRDRSAMSLRQLDAASGVAWGTIHRTEHGKRVCTETELADLAGAWGLTAAELLNWAKVEAQYPAKAVKVCACQPKEIP